MASRFLSDLKARARRLSRSPSYANYKRVCDYLGVMMDDWVRLDPDGGPSAYWKEEIEGFLYLFDASPLLVEKMREQCYHITGIKSYEYRTHHSHQARRFIPKYKMLKKADPTGLFVPEPPEMGGFGLDVGDGRVNLDLPPTMIFSGTYLTTLFPNAKALFYGERNFDKKIKNLKDYDFVFVPHYYWPKLQQQHQLDLAINMVSFQEMTTEQVTGYAKGVSECRAPLYSLNRDRSKNNDELTAVSEILGAHFDLTPIDVLPLQYFELKAGGPPTADLHLYRHFLARPK
jgi:hypothetical protein